MNFFMLVRSRSTNDIDVQHRVFGSCRNQVLEHYDRTLIQFLQIFTKHNTRVQSTYQYLFISYGDLYHFLSILPIETEKLATRNLDKHLPPIKLLLTFRGFHLLFNVIKRKSRYRSVAITLVGVLSVTRNKVAVINKGFGTIRVTCRVTFPFSSNYGDIGALVDIDYP